jgi:hypothetical protein
MMATRFNLVAALVSLLAFAACSDNGVSPKDPDNQPKVSVDRFSGDAGTLFVRTAANGLPGPNEAIDFDVAPFITQGFGPAGEVVRYYNFDVQPTSPAPIYVLFRVGESTPVAGQLNIIDVIPGDAGYNDFWQVHTVTVPTGYQANTLTSYAGIVEAGYPIVSTTTAVNCPVVPDGSTANMKLGGGVSALVRGWYKDQVVSYFAFEEKALSLYKTSVPLSPIYVTFNIDVTENGGGPPSGFKAETGTDQTHNVLATLPADADYSPLWLVNAYDNDEFDGVANLTTAQSATILGAGIATVNCPVVSIQ